VPFSHPALVALAAAAFLALALFGGPFPTLTTQGLFFSGTALVTFGSAYAVLAYVAQRAVETYGWRTPNEMVRGLALSETTPGPLIMVVQFVAFLGAYHHPDPLSPWTAALMGALLTTWVTFVPCFFVHLPGHPVCGAAARQPEPVGCPDRDHRRRGRGDRQPWLCTSPSTPCSPPRTRCAGGPYRRDCPSSGACSQFLWRSPPRRWCWSSDCTGRYHAP
jgi:hypothetical protein